MVEIQAGEGGDDSKLFVHDLGAAYVKWAKRNSLTVEIVYTDESHFSLLVSGRLSAQIFIQESGKHCVQRVPPTEKRGRRQTSTVGVIVTEFGARARKSNVLQLHHVSISTMRGSGPGGQHKQKTESCVRARHIPTGISVTIDGRDQSSNKKLALEILAQRVADHEVSMEKDLERRERNRQWDGGNRSNKIRTYNFIESRAVDHRYGTKTRNVEDVIYKGRFDLLK